MKDMTIVMMILVAALSRLIPHVPNVTAVTALALLGGVYLSHRASVVLVPLIALFVTDLVLGFHDTMLFVYVSIALIALASSFKLSEKWNWTRLLGASFSASVFFFLVTNFGVWFAGAFYPMTAQGLVACYVAALPFLGTQVLGDLFYTGLLFGAVEGLRVWKPALVSVR